MAIMISSSILNSVLNYFLHLFSNNSKFPRSGDPGCQKIWTAFWISICIYIIFHVILYQNQTQKLPNTNPLYYNRYQNCSTTQIHSQNIQIYKKRLPPRHIDTRIITTRPYLISIPNHRYTTHTYPFRSPIIDIQHTTYTIPCLFFKRIESFLNIRI